MLAHVVESDAQLVARCRAGDEDAWRELVERFSRYVYAISVQAYRLSESDAEDVFQEVFARAYVNLPKLRDDTAIRPWLAQLTRRLCLDTLRAGAREQLDELPEPAGVDERSRGSTRRCSCTTRSPRSRTNCREILDRFFARDESYRSIGEALDIPPGTIASRISRCLVKLKTEMRRGKKTGACGVWWLTVCATTTRKPWPISFAHSLPRRRRGSRLRRRSRSRGKAWTTSSSAPGRIRRFRDALIADLERRSKAPATRRIRRSPKPFARASLCRSEDSRRHGR